MSSGRVWIHFDGNCISDSGDVIILAANNIANWFGNYGCVTVEAVDTDIKYNSFSHTRVFNVNAGSHDFYAVVENLVETDGSGYISVYGTLTVEFFPNVVSDILFSNEIPTDYILE